MAEINQNLALFLLGRGLDRLHHALLLVGPAGVGKLAFAEEVAAVLLCEQPGPGPVACGQCQGCRWLQGGNHPDFRRVGPEGEEEGDEPAPAGKKKGPGTIRIDQIRELEDFVFVGSHRHGRRVILITNADAMNAAAANSLLKILEEPPATVYFILVSSNQKQLLPTIRSRCQVVSFPVPETAVAGAWLRAQGVADEDLRYLALAGGAPMRVLQWRDEGQWSVFEALIETLVNPPPDPLVLAARWDSLLKGDGAFRLEHLVDGVQRWLFDLAQERIVGAVRYHAGWPRPAYRERLDPMALLGAWREIHTFRRSARHPLNQLLFLESLAAIVLRALRPVPP